MKVTFKIKKIGKIIKVLLTQKNYLCYNSYC